LRWIAIFVGGFTIFAVLNRAYSSPYGTLPGEVVLALVTGLYAAGLGWLHRLGTMSSPGRFLAQDPARPDGGPERRERHGRPAITRGQR
ncbi:MAG TPA: hypothetical protein VH307_14250, partial [Streptosporangiaceae bacterium]|nr:hypothetical protein [Streptosporangiaceae bacterium]